MNGRPLEGVELSTVTDTKPGKAPSVSRATKAHGQTGKVTGKTRKISKTTQSSKDGIFFLLDCPEGECEVTALNTQTAMEAKQLVSLSDRAREKPVKERGLKDGYQIELVLKNKVRLNQFEGLERKSIK